MTAAIVVRQTAPPCRDCNTRYGVANMPGGPPRRVWGLCGNCYVYHTRAGTIGHYRQAPPPLRPPVAPVAPGKLRDVSERRYERIEEIATRVARHEGVPHPLYEDEDNTKRRTANAEALGIIIDEGQR